MPSFYLQQLREPLKKCVCVCVCEEFVIGFTCKHSLEREFFARSGFLAAVSDDYRCILAQKNAKAKQTNVCWCS